MRSRTALALAAALTLTTAVAGAQQKPGQQAATQKSAQQKTTVTMMPKPAISADSAKSIVLANVKGATVASEKLENRKGERYYLFMLREPNHRAAVRATVDATNGKFSRLDKAPQK